MCVHLGEGMLRFAGKAPQVSRAHIHHHWLTRKTHKHKKEATETPGPREEVCVSSQPAFSPANQKYIYTSAKCQVIVYSLLCSASGVLQAQ